MNSYYVNVLLEETPHVDIVLVLSEGIRGGHSELEPRKVEEILNSAINC